MTTFMNDVTRLVTGGAVDRLAEITAAPRRPVPVGADRYVALRALAEQLAAEANGALRPTGIRVELEDERRDGQLGFGLSCGGATVSFVTELAGGVAVVHLDGLGHDGGELELNEPGELEAVILELIRRALGRDEELADP
ncbi:MAG: hypothetical protein M0Z46_01810 [Actinomycetota bacterium]|nr:hypothetical protein [Actinomycetota bacterium]